MVQENAKGRPCPVSESADKSRSIRLVVPDVPSDASRTLARETHGKPLPGVFRQSLLNLERRFETVTAWIDGSTLRSKNQRRLGVVPGDSGVWQRIERSRQRPVLEP